MKKIQIKFRNEIKDIKFTDPQAKIVERLLRGDKVTMINTHYRSGGDFVWYDADGYSWSKEYVGYKAFWGAMYAVRKAFNLNRVDEYSDQFFI